MPNRIVSHPYTPRIVPIKPVKYGRDHMVHSRNVRMSIKAGNTTHVVDADQVCHIEAASNYTTFHLKDGRQIVISKTLKDVLRVLPSNQFIRVHQSHIIHIDAIVTIDSQHRITLTNSQVVPLARARKTRFYQVIQNQISIHI